MKGEYDLAVNFIIQAKSISKYLKQIRIGNTLTDNNVFLAPMAGGSELPFRKICRRMGAGLVCTELVTARGIRYKHNLDNNFRYLQIDPAEFPAVIQLFAGEPEDFDYAIAAIFGHPLLSQCAAIDINMGCPVPKVLKSGAGCALMGDPARASRIIAASVKASPVPVTVKFRSGLDMDTRNAVDFGRMCEQSGASLITVHPRTAKQMYAGKSDWNIITEVKQAVGIPVVGNGDILCPADAVRMFGQTGADGIMVGRAALGNPWIFRSLLAGLAGDPGEADTSGRICIPTMADRIAIIREQIDGSIAQMGEITAMKEMRKHFAWYFKGIPNCSAVKAELVRCETRVQAMAILDQLM
ncbi:MAG: tRNA dihydrouridine synthase DusB [Saccharofermentanales bacterium]